MSNLLLDTTFLIDAERSFDDLDRLIADDDDIAIAAISIAELLVGVALASPQHRSARQEFVDSVRESLPVLDYDTAVADHHADLLVAVREAGRPRGAHDLIIAATARGNNRTVLSNDSSAFSDLPGVQVMGHG